MAQPPRVFLITDDRMLAEVLAALIDRDQNVRLCSLESDARDLTDSIRLMLADIVLLDANIQSADAIAIARTIKIFSPCIKIIVIGLEYSEEKILRFIEAGISGYVLKEHGVSDLLRTIDAVYNGNALCSPRILASVFARIAELCRERNRQSAAQASNLSQREKDILRLMAVGLGNKEIAQRLAISLSTVKNHVHNLFDKLQVRYRKEAIKVGYELGILSQPLAAEKSFDQNTVPTDAGRPVRVKIAFKAVIPLFAVWVFHLLELASSYAMGRFG